MPELEMVSGLQRAFPRAEGAYLGFFLPLAIECASPLAQSMSRAAGKRWKQGYRRKDCWRKASRSRLGL